jgi:hypothetical protein
MILVDGTFPTAKAICHVARSHNCLPGSGSQVLIVSTTSVSTTEIKLAPLNRLFTSYLGE